MKSSAFYQRLSIIIAACLVAIYFMFTLQQADLMQDYAAAWARWHGLSANSKTAEIMQQCCSGFTSMLAQTAHPPTFTLLFMPFALVPWVVAQALWLTLSCVLTLWVWQTLQVPISTCVALSVFVMVGFKLGNIEPIILALLTGAILLQKRNSLWSGCLIGIAAAIKVYPLLFVIGLWIAGQRKSALAAVVTGAALSVVAELVLGLGTTQGWLAFTAVNTLTQIKEVPNISLARMIYLINEHTPPFLISLILVSILFGTSIKHIRKSDGISSVLPAVLLATPISWNHYLTLLAFYRLSLVEIILISVPNVITILIWFDMIPGDNLASFDYPPLTILLLLLWFRLRRATEAQAPQRITLSNP